MSESPFPPSGRLAPPAFRRLRGYAFDPSLSLEMDTALVNEVVFRVPWRESPLAGEVGAEPARLQPGPIGEYLEVIDVDPASDCMYAPIDLDAPAVLAQDRVAPSEGNPQFHQQMVYAVAMTTIKNFERALGRPVLWASVRGKGGAPDVFVPRLRVYPHALREANAYYSPAKKALLFGYFPAAERTTKRARGVGHFPGGWVFTCLSHDVIAHETTHALLDGMHRRFIEPTHPDALAFHEAFADIVALFQHFTFPEVLRHQIARTRGDLTSHNLLGQLAQQFGQAIGQHGALRDAIGGVGDDGRWAPKEPDPEELLTTYEPHARGAILVAAVFEAFLAIYRRRVADLLRIASSGTGVLPEGELHPDLVARLASEATKSAQHVLQMCIRALDYCPPVDITFGDYLRAVITADCDLVPDDDMGYRVAFIEAFRRRGIYPRSVRTLSIDALRWPLATRGRDATYLARFAQQLKEELPGITDHAATREQYFHAVSRQAEALHGKIASGRRFVAELTALLDGAIDFAGDLPDVERSAHTGGPKFEVHSVRPAKRVGPDGDRVNHVVVVLTQKRLCPRDPRDPALGDFKFRGGSTLIFDLDTFALRYAISKGIGDAEREARQREYLVSGRLGDLWNTYFAAADDDQEPFAIMHRGHAEVAP